MRFLRVVNIPMMNMIYHEGWDVMNEQKDKIVLPKKLQNEMMKFFFEVATRRKKQIQIEIRLSENNDRSEA